MHSTNNLEDNYIGSGKILVWCIKKYGINNFKKEIIEFLSSRKDLEKREAEIVNEDMILNPLCMNLKPGGSGGGVKGVKRTIYTRKKISSARKGIEFSKLHKQNLSKAGKGRTPWNKGKKLPSLTKEHKDKLSKKLKGRPSPMLGRKHTQETKNEMSKKSKIRSDNNPNWWVLNDAARKNQKRAVSLALKGKKKKTIKCPHCNKIGGEPQMKQWHFDKCKRKL